MPDRSDDALPPLGERTPARPGRRRTAPARRPPALVAVVALVVGLVSGYGLARALEGDDGGDDATTTSHAKADVTLPPTTQTTLPDVCEVSMRAAEDAVTLLEEGLQDLRKFRLAEVSTTVREMQRLQRRLDGSARKCRESIGR